MFYRTKMTVEIEVEHQFSPIEVMNFIKQELQCPAVTSVEFIKGETNYRLWKDPAETMTEFALDNPFNLETSPR